MKTQVGHTQTNVSAVATTANQDRAGSVTLPAVPVLQQKEQETDLSSSTILFAEQSAAPPAPPEAPFRPAVGIQRMTKAPSPSKQLFKPAQLKKTGSVGESSSAFIPMQRKANQTGLPDSLKTGIEKMSGVNISDVKVHYNSAKPATVQAHAYAQGTDIHVAPGRETHLPHEAWHVVQQKQGRVQPTMQLNGMAVNDDTSLEQEADAMGAQAVQRAAQSNDTAVPGSVHTLDLHKELHNVARHLDGRAGNAIQLQAAQRFIKEDTEDGTQMAKSVFLEKVKAQAALVADAALQPLGQTSAECPFIDYWITFYQAKTAAEIEKALQVYVPESEGVTEADAVISLVAAKVNQRLQEQIAKSGLAPADASEPDTLTDEDGEVTDMAPPKQLKQEEGVVQRGCLVPNRNPAPPRQQPPPQIIAPPAREDAPDRANFAAGRVGSQAFKREERRFAALPADRVQLPGMPAPGDPPLEAGFRHDNIQFISRNAGGVGSIYFPAGRIRLEHPSGPEITTYGMIRRYAITPAAKDRFEYLRDVEDRTAAERFNTMTAEGLLNTDAAAGAAGTILEFMEDPPNNCHPSGGSPVAIDTVIQNITQDQVNIICAGARSKNNAVLRQYMNTDPGLRNVPTAAAR